jgi:hypothetical protein
VRGNSFVIPAGAVDVNATLAKIGQSLSSVLQIPVDVTYAYGTPTASALSRHRQRYDHLAVCHWRATAGRVEADCEHGSSRTAACGL